MKLLPLTLTLFDKVTNNTYKGTVLLKNLNNPEPAVNASNATRALIGDEYDGKGAGLFIILVISVYALSIVLFIASFITKKAGVAESLNEESTVTTYLHKVGDLKEKTAREHFKKLKMSIISKVEADSQNQRRGRKGSRGAKDMATMSRASSRSSLSENKIHVERPKSSNGTEQIPSTGLLPKEDDAKLPLLGTDPCETPTPPVGDTLLSPNFEPWGPHGRSTSPSLRRATSPRTLSIIKEQENEQGEDSDSSRKRALQNQNGLKRKARGSVDSLRAQSEHRSCSETPEGFPTDDSDDEDDYVCGSPTRAMSDTEIMGHAHSTFIDENKTASLGRQPRHGSPQSPPRQFTRSLRSDPQIERPRPKHSTPQPENYEDVWEQMPQKLMPPPRQRGNRNPKNLYVQIPQSALNSSDIWVLRNNRRAVFLKERSPSPSSRGETPRGDKQVTQQQPKQSQALPAQRPTTLESSKLRRDRSLRDRAQQEVSPPDQRSMCLSPQENLNLPRPFRTPSPRSPTEQFFSPRGQDPRSTRDTFSPGRSQTVAQGPDSARDKDKAVVKITLDRSTDHPTGDQGWANGAFDQSPRPRSHRSEAERREQTPTRFTFTDGAPTLEVPQPRAQFPVTFNSPGFPRRKEEKL